MNIGIIGTGFMGTTHAGAWAKAGAHIAGFLADPPSEAAAIARQYGAKACFNLGELIGLADVVDICSPTHLHAEMAIRAAQAGKHVVCEKPLALTVEQGEAMLHACRTANVKLFVAHVVRYFPEYSLAAAQVHAGKIGKVATAEYRRLSYRPKKPVRNWFLDEEKSGGILLDLMIILHRPLYRGRCRLRLCKKSDFHQQGQPLRLWRGNPHACFRCTEPCLGGMGISAACLQDRIRNRRGRRFNSA